MAKKFSCEIKVYNLELYKPAKTSRNTISIRKIWILRLMDNFGKEGLGEIAPLEGLSRELTLDFENKLKEIASNIDLFINNYVDLQDYPSIIFGLETAWLNYRHSNFLFYKNPLTLSQKAIPYNALVWMGDYDNMKEQIDFILSKNTSCIKLKIGGIKWEQELALIAYIRQNQKDNSLQIRLDANGAFERGTALDKLNDLSPYNIHSIEQPIAPNQISDLSLLVEKSPIPIALDEELIGRNTYAAKMNLLKDVRPHFIVLKPSIHGGLKGCEEWIFLAKQFNINWWITSALESNIGLNAIAQWAGNFEESYTTPQGLGTGEMYQNNFPTHLESKDYYMYMQP